MKKSYTAKLFSEFFFFSEMAFFGGRRSVDVDARGKLSELPFSSGVQKFAIHICIL